MGRTVTHLVTNWRLTKVCVFWMPVFIYYCFHRLPHIWRVHLTQSVSSSVAAPRSVRKTNCGFATENKGLDRGDLVSWCVGSVAGSVFRLSHSNNCGKGSISIVITKCRCFNPRDLCCTPLGFQSVCGDLNHLHDTCLVPPCWFSPGLQINSDMNCGGHQLTSTSRKHLNIHTLRETLQHSHHPFHTMFLITNILPAYQRQSHFFKEKKNWKRLRGKRQITCWNRLKLAVDRSV